MNLWLWLPAGLSALGVGLLTLGVGNWLLDLWTGVSRRRLWRPLATTGASADKPLSPEELFDIPPLLPWMALGSLGGLLISSTLLQGALRGSGLLGGLIPLLWKQQRIRVGRQQIRREIADLVDTLRLYLAFAATPGTALVLAIDENEVGLLWQRLRRHRDSVYVQGPEVVLADVATELDSADLRHLLARVRAARAGSTGLAEVLQAVAVEMTAELHQELGEQVEAAPTRLIVPLLAALLPPLLVLVLNPALQAFLDTLAGVGPMPLGG